MRRAETPAPAVSVIVPSYDHAPFLRERLDSIFGQTFDDFEVVLLDDGSTDGSVDVLRGYASEPRVRHFVVSDENSGRPCGQWRKGLELARGRFVWIAESDDAAEPAFLETMVGLLEGNERRVLAYCRSLPIDAGSVITGDWYWADGLDPERWHHPFVARGSDEIDDCLRFRNVILNASAVVFRRDVANRVEMPEELVFCGDWVFWMRMLRHGDVAYTPERLNRFRTHPSTTRHVGRNGAELAGRQWQRVCESLRALDECGARLVPVPRRGARDHHWLVQALPGGGLETARHLLRCHTVSRRLRMELVAAAASSSIRRAAKRVLRG